MTSKQKKDVSQGNKVVLSKIPREEFSKFQRYCEVNGESINSAIKRMIMAEIANPSSLNVAGKNVFLYNKNTDTFTWRVTLDDGSMQEVASDISPSFVEQLYRSISKANEERDSYIKKENKESVPVPTRILKDKK
jgi:hypothetical protein